jgi:micrococcal nuclease
VSPFSASDRRHRPRQRSCWKETVFLEADPSQGERDSFDRLLRYVFLEDGESFNERMFAEGYAHEYTFDLPYTYQAEYREAEQTARQQQRGLWHPETCAGDTMQPGDASPSATPNEAPADLLYDPSGPDRDCGDFDRWDDAQAFYEAAGGPSKDPHQLDGEGDGIACESLAGAP